MMIVMMVIGDCDDGGDYNDSDEDDCDRLLCSELICS